MRRRHLGEQGSSRGGVELQSDKTDESSFAGLPEIEADPVSAARRKIDADAVMIRRRSQKTSAPEKKAITRGPRGSRAFTYRDIEFYIKTENDVASIYTLNSSTDKLELQAKVPVKNARRASQEIARIILAEKTLESLSE